MKKVLSFLMAVIMLFALSACNRDNSNDSLGNTPGNTSTPDNMASNSKPILNRLKKVTVTYEGETIECNITWDDNTCYFESYMNYFKDPIENYRGVFEPETNTFSIVWDQENGTTIEMPVFDYNDDQKIIAMYNEDNPSEVWNVTYDENGVPSLMGGKPLFEYDPTTKQVKRFYSSGSTEGVAHETYDVVTLDDNGCFIGVDRLTYTDDGTGTLKLTDTKEDYYKYTYDESGNLIRYEEPHNSDGLVIEYEYYDEPIQHLWEIIIPIHYIDVFEIFEVPFLWYLN